jgi:hypothetical protein
MKMDVKEIGFGNVNQIKLVHCWFQWQAFVLVVFNMQVVIVHSYVYHFIPK